MGANLVMTPPIRARYPATACVGYARRRPRSVASYAITRLQCGQIQVDRAAKLARAANMHA